MNWAALSSTEVWLRGLLAATISGAANGIVTGLAAIGIDSEHFNLQAGVSNTLHIAGAAATISALLGLAMYLQKSPLPQQRQVWTDEQRAAAQLKTNTARLETQK